MKQGFKKGHGNLRTKESYLLAGKKISHSSLGKIFSPIHKIRLSLAKVGRKVPLTQKKRMSEAQYKRWSSIPKKEFPRYKHLMDKKTKQFRSDIFERDNWTCQTCGIRGIYLEVHHIKSWAKFPELRYDLKNAVTLCLECHKLTDNYKNKGGSGADF